MGNNKKALKSGIWYTFANFAMSALTFLTTPIFTRLLSKSDYGIYSAYSSWVQILTIIVPLNFGATLICAKYDYPEDYKRYIYSCMSFTLVFSALWCAIVNVFSDSFTGLFGFGIGYINIMIAYVCFVSIVNIFISAERCLFEYKKAVFVSVLQAVATAVLAILLVLLMKDKLTGRIIGAAFPSIAIGLAVFAFYAIKYRRINIGYAPYALKICLPYIPHALSLVVLNSVDRIMIKRICGAEDAALYSLAYTCSMVITVLVAAMNEAFAPWLAEKLNEEKYGEIKDVAKKYVLLFSGLVVGIVLVAPEIMLMLGGKSYGEALYVLPPVMGGCIFQFLYSMYVNIEQIKKKTMGMACASVAAAVLNYVLNALFIPKYGYIAAAYTTLAGYAFLLLIHMILVKNFIMDVIYDNRLTLALAAVTLGFVAMVSKIYGHSALRYAILAVYLATAIAIGVKNKQKIKEVIGGLIH